MRNIVLAKSFTKNYKRRVSNNKKLSEEFKQKIILFANGDSDNYLRDHALQGSLKGLRAFSITADVRVIYECVDDKFILLDIGTHNQVYK